MPHLFRSASPHNRYYAWFTALHTRIDLLLLGASTEAEFEAAEEAVCAELAAIAQMGNRFDPDSELSRAVAAGRASGGSPRLSPPLFALLSRCLRAHRETDGLFDITINSPSFTPGRIQSVELIPEDDSGRLRLHRSDIILDLSGILKGYALERLRHLLPTFNITNALVNLGNSSILSLGHNPSDIPPGYCLTTSGNATATRRHIINPLTGHPVTGQREVSVTTPDGIDGEILSTVSFIRSALAAAPSSPSSSSSPSSTSSPSSSSSTPSFSSPSSSPLIL